MSSTRDAGHYASEQLKKQDSHCEMSSDGKHVWKLFGSWPSTWQVCQACKMASYSK